MKLHPVSNSSSLRAIGYDQATLTLEIEFTSGALYRYAKVPKAAYDGLTHAEKPGEFFVTFVRPCYEYERVHIAGCLGNLMCQTMHCGCWCHKVRKDVSNGSSQNSESAETKSEETVSGPPRKKARKGRG